MPRTIRYRVQIREYATMTTWQAPRMGTVSKVRYTPWRTVETFPWTDEGREAAIAACRHHTRAGLKQGRVRSGPDTIWREG